MAKEVRIWMIRYRLPEFQYTAREMKSGIVFYAFAYNNNSANEALFAAYLSNHLKKYGIEMDLTIYQTDNGSEFIGNVKKKEGDSAFEVVVRG
jgi:L-fucose isomerase-like protein